MGSEIRGTIRYTYDGQLELRSFLVAGAQQAMLSKAPQGLLTSQQQQAELLEVVPPNHYHAHRVFRQCKRCQRPFGMTKREIEIVQLILKKLQEQEQAFRAGNAPQKIKWVAIAGELSVSSNVMRFHVKNIYWKLEVTSKKEAFKAIRQYQAVFIAKQQS